MFVEVFQKWDGGIAEPGAYLQRAVVNRCRDALRRTRVARRYRRLVRPEDVPAIDAPMYDALATLPFKHRTAVVLRYYLDPFCSIRAVLQASPSPLANVVRGRSYLWRVVACQGGLVGGWFPGVELGSGWSARSAARTNDLDASEHPGMMAVAKLVGGVWAALSYLGAQANGLGLVT